MRAVFLDRDGVLNALITGAEGQPRPPWNPSEIHICPEAQDAVNLLTDLDFVVFVVTNQPDVGRAQMSEKDANAVNERLLCEVFGITQVYSCSHTQEDRCECRKPEPGMLIQAAREWALDLSKNWLVGDGWVDVLAGERAGCRTVLVEQPQSWSATSAGSPPNDLAPTFVVGDVLRGPNSSSIPTCPPGD